MSEEGGVEVCHVCQEIFLEEDPLKSHMKEMHPDVEQLKSEGGRTERYSNVVAKLEKQISSHDLEQALAEESIKKGLQKESSNTEGEEKVERETPAEELGAFTKDKKHLEGRRESKKRRRESSVEEACDDQRKSTREVSRSPRKSSVKHIKKDYQEKNRKREDSVKSAGERSRQRSEGRENEIQRKYEGGRDGERKDKRYCEDQNRSKGKSGKGSKVPEGGRKERDKFGEKLSRSGDESELRKKAHSKSSKHRVLHSVVQGDEERKVGEVKAENNVKVGSGPPRDNVHRFTSSRGEKDLSSVKPHGNWEQQGGSEDKKARGATCENEVKVVASPFKGKNFASRGGVKEHDNLEGPSCPKCGQVCKSKDTLRNHVLSHYYELFFEVLPGVSPFTCPECDKEPSRDRITLTRHYAFAHNKLFEMTDVTPEMLNPSSPKKHNTTRKEQDEEDVANRRQDRVEKEDMKLDVKEDIKLEMREDIKLEVKEDIKLEVKDDIKLEVKEDIKCEEKEDIKCEEKGDIKLEKEDTKLGKEHLKLKESVAALGVKSDSNFVLWQKSFGKHDAPSGKKRKKEGETKEQRRERKEKKRAERKEAERREANRWEKEKQQSKIKGSRSEDCTINEMKKSGVVGKPLFSLMMQELDNSSSWSKGKEGERKAKKEDSDYEFTDADFPEPVYACKPDCRCSFHF